MLRPALFACTLLILTACATNGSTEPSAPPASPADRANECDAVQKAIAAERAQLAACTNDAECGKPISTPGSCGCTRSAVARLGADETKYQALLAQLDALSDVPGCARRMGTCDCPEMDGMFCREGHCAWKPLDRSTLCDRLVDRYTGTRQRECEGGDPNACAATLAIKDGVVTFVHDGMTHAGHFQCHDGAMTVGGHELATTAQIHPDGSISFGDDDFKPDPGAAQQQQPAPVEHVGNRSTFMPPSGDINCVYTGRGGIGIYTPGDGGPEMMCDRSSGTRYERVWLGASGPAKIAKRVGDASCCGVEPVLPEGAQLRRGPFECKVEKARVICKRDDGYGFELGGPRARVFKK